MREMPVESLVVHPDAGKVPEMPADEYTAFLADVRSRGVKVPLELLPGTQTVLDGRTRLRAAREAGLSVVPVIDAGLSGEEPVVYMLRAALTRRHLTSGQRAALGVEIEAELAKAAKERQRAAGGDRKSPTYQEVREKLASEGRLFRCTACDEEFTDAKVWHCGVCAHHWPMHREECWNCHKGTRRKAAGKSVPQKIAEPIRGEARDQAAEQVGTNRQYVSDAKRIAAKAPDLFEKVKTGEMTIPEAKAEIRRQEKREELKARAEAAELCRRMDAEDQLDVIPDILVGRQGWAVVEDDCVANLRKMKDGVARLVFADPPYNIGFDYGHGYDDARPPFEYLGWCAEWMAACHRVLSDDGALWVLINHEYAAFFELLLRGDVLINYRDAAPGSVERMFDDLPGAAFSVLTGFARFHVRSWVTWYETFGVNCTDKFNRCSRRLFYCVKNPKQFVFHPEAVSRPSDRQAKYNDARANPDGKLLDDVWLDIPRLVGTAAERIPDFPTQLPLALLRRVIACCTDPADLVVDPFSGSGTTGAAALELGRRYVGIERNPQFAELSRIRLEGVPRG